MRLVFYTFFYFVGLIVVHAQYYAIKEVAEPESDYPRANSVPQDHKRIEEMKATNDELSSVQEIPFDFDFFGNKVSSYKISDNGYIIFDENEIVSYPLQEALPSSNGPKNAIFACWTDLEFKTISGLNADITVPTTFTYGSEPKRRHLIRWNISSKQGISPPETNAYFFSIVLKEEGGFLVIHDGEYYNPATISGGFSAVVGCQNGDGSQGYSENVNSLLTDGTTGPFVSPYNIWEFREGLPPKNDIELISTNSPEIAKKDDDFTFDYTIKNWGSNPVSSIVASYEYDGQKFNQTISNLNILKGETKTITLTDIPFLAEECKNVDFICQVAINGQEDENPENNKLNESIFFNYGVDAMKKRIVMEVFTTAECGYCPDGKSRFQDLINNNYFKLIPVNIHSCFSTDAMTIPEGETYCADMSSGAPTGLINRLYNKNWQLSNPDKPGMGRGSWTQNTIDDVYKMKQPVEVNLTVQTDDAARITSGNVKCKFIDFMPEDDYRIVVYVIQRTMSGSGSGWDQSNYLNNEAGHRFQGLGNPIRNYKHAYVLRDVLTPVYGTPLDISGPIEANQEFNLDFTHNVPAQDQWDPPSQLFYAAYIMKHSEDVTKRRILNADRSENFLSISRSPLGNNSEISIYPNPTSDFVNVSIRSEKSFKRVSIAIIDMFGREVKHKEQDLKSMNMYNLQFNVRDLPKGIYKLNISANNETIGKKIILN